MPVASAIPCRELRRRLATSILELRPIRTSRQEAAAGRPQPPVPALYLTVSLDESEPTATRRLRANVEAWYGRRLEMVASLQAMYAGTPQGLAAYLEPYVNAGVRHVALRVADAPERGLAAAAQAVRALSGVTPARAGDVTQNERPSGPAEPRCYAGYSSLR
jgi:hypothetical protein